MFAQMKDRQWGGYEETFIVTGLDGTPTILNFRIIIDICIHNMIVQSVIFGFSLGFVSIIFIALVLLSPTDKLRKPTVLLSLATQLLLILRCITSLICLCAPYNGLGEILLEATIQYPPSTYTPKIVGSIAALLLHDCILALLILQVRAMFAVERQTRTVLTIVGIIAGIVLQGFMVAWLIHTSLWVFYRSSNARGSIQHWWWVYYTFRIYFVSFVGVSCSLFLWKLAVTINDRRKLCASVTQLGPLQITFIMFTQSLIIPRNPPGPTPGVSLAANLGLQ